MNVSFWGAMLSLLLVAIVITIFPLLRIRQSKSLAYKTSNIQLHEEKLNELNIDLQEDRIDQAAYKIARQELDRELLIDAPIENKETAALHYTAEAKKHPALALAIAVFIPTLSLLVYMQLGMHADAEQEAAATATAAEKTMPSVEEMVAKLEQYLQENKGELKDWVMLGRSYKHLGRYGEAANAFAAASELEQNPQVMLEHAEVIALMNDQKFNEQAHDLALKALALAPDNVNALWFSGVAEFQFANYRESIKYLSQLSSVAEQDAEIDRSLRFYISQAREQLIAAGESVASMDELLPPVKAEPLANLASIKVKVDVSADARQNFTDADIVFVYAKALTGPKMPLAAQRLTLADLPATVVLDDSMAMMEGMNISAFKQVVVSARVTRTGAAIAQSGDYIGQVTVADVTSTDEVTVNIDSLVP
ncbi:MAG: c-type cytochrome biogenesis protein CcmI [Gammaproteobacteria bacterium]|nr:c-type cytochrome biogenesis protein CcmI [Gammaproteobacteria bacterium]MCK5262318.1 c-type cytochrome biogenesis protein CcmI [Gammaproteobacteria bacterium]